MFEMHKACNAVADKISSELNLDHERREVIAYGTFALLQIVISISLVMLFGWLFGVVVEALIISFTSNILRKYSGGVHASTPTTCIIIGTAACIGMTGLLVFLSPVLSFSLIVFLGLFTFMISYYLIYRLAPVDNPSKPITKEEKRQRMKKGSIWILTVYAAVVFFLMMLYLVIREKKLLLYSTCIYVGIIWQVFTLTRSGHLFVTKIDTFLNQILFIIKGEK